MTRLAFTISDILKFTTSKDEQDLKRFLSKIKYFLTIRGLRGTTRIVINDIFLSSLLLLLLNPDQIALQSNNIYYSQSK